MDPNLYRGKRIDEYLRQASDGKENKTMPLCFVMVILGVFILVIHVSSLNYK